MDKVKSIDKKKVKKVVDKAKKAWYKVDKQKLAKLGMQLLTYFTKAKGSTAKTFGLISILGILATNFGPKGVRSELDVANETIRQLQEQVEGTTFLHITQDTVINGADTTIVTNWN
jgi:hypothetical protein